MLEISKIKNKDKNLYLKEFKSINEKFKNIYTVLEIERQELAYLKVENTSLQKLNKTYLFEKHKAVNMLEEIDSESNKRLIENLALKERIKYLESNINNS
jgi:ssRNA-specific RNase YbeY (16S rRNA maturation enzyme)